MQKVLILVAICALFFAVYHDLERTRDVQISTGCLSNLEMIALGMHWYHQAHGCFPPAYLTDNNGRPMHSWRVLILPYLPGEEALYQAYDFNEPWDGPKNRKLAGFMPMVYGCQGRYHPGGVPWTNYVVVVGEETMFPGSRSTRIADVRDDPARTLLFAEVAGPGYHWMEPRDLKLNEMSLTLGDRSKPSLSGNDGYRGPGVSFVGKSFYRLPESLPPSTVRALITIAGGETIPSDL